MEQIQKSIFDFGTVGDGVTDDSAAFNRALAGGFHVTVPAGEYLIGHTLTVGSNTTVEADTGAHIKLAAGAQKGRYDFLLTTKPGTKTENVSITGGIWDGNGFMNDRGNDLYDQNATTGVLFNFRGIDRLALSKMIVKDPLCYYFRFCEAEHVTITDVRFATEKILPNQDGLHFSGFCRHFKISGLYGTYGSPNDDFLAFNADDALNRQESFDVINGPIEDVEIENVHSESCHCFIRLLSVTSPIRDVKIRHLTGVTRHCLLNMDMARGCRTPLFKEEDYLEGVGFLENIEISDLRVDHDNPEDKKGCDQTFIFQGNVKNFTVRDVRMTDGESDLFDMEYLTTHRLSLRGVKDLTDVRVNAAGLTVNPTEITGTIRHDDTLRMRLSGFDEMQLERIN